MSKIFPSRNIVKLCVECDLVDAFVALGGTPDLKGTISKEKIVTVLLHDFELTLDMEVR